MFKVIIFKLFQSVWKLNWKTCYENEYLFAPKKFSSQLVLVPRDMPDFKLKNFKFQILSGYLQKRKFKYKLLD